MRRLHKFLLSVMAGMCMLVCTGAGVGGIEISGTSKTSTTPKKKITLLPFYINSDNIFISWDKFENEILLLLNEKYDIIKLTRYELSANEHLDYSRLEKESINKKGISGIKKNDNVAEQMIYLAFSEDKGFYKAGYGRAVVDEKGKISFETDTSLFNTPKQAEEWIKNSIYYDFIDEWSRRREKKIIPYRHRYHSNIMGGVSSAYSDDFSSIAGNPAGAVYRNSNYAAAYSNIFGLGSELEAFMPPFGNAFISFAGNNIFHKRNEEKQGAELFEITLNAGISRKITANSAAGIGISSIFHQYTFGHSGFPSYKNEVRDDTTFQFNWGLTNTFSPNLILGLNGSIRKKNEDKNYIPDYLFRLGGAFLPFKRITATADVAYDIFRYGRSFKGMNVFLAYDFKTVYNKNQSRLGVGYTAEPFDPYLNLSVEKVNFAFYLAPKWEKRSMGELSFGFSILTSKNNIKIENNDRTYYGEIYPWQFSIRWETEFGY
ncbi:MAG: hypothetical protein ABIA63_10135 [bacterium]